MLSELTELEEEEKQDEYCTVGDNITHPTDSKYLQDNDLGDDSSEVTTTGIVNNDKFNEENYSDVTTHSRHQSKKKRL
eukprot:UN29504